MCLIRSPIVKYWHWSTIVCYIVHVYKPSHLPIAMLQTWLWHLVIHTDSYARALSLNKLIRNKMLPQISLYKVTIYKQKILETSNHSNLNYFYPYRRFGSCLCTSYWAHIYIYIYIHASSYNQHVYLFFIRKQQLSIKQFFQNLHLHDKPVDYFFHQLVKHILF